MSTGKTERVVGKPSNLEYYDVRTSEETMKLPIIPIHKQKSMPKTGFRMKVQPIITASWRRYFKGQAKEKVAAVMEYAKTFFKHVSLETKYELEVLPVKNYPKSLSANSDDLK